MSARPLSRIVSLKEQPSLLGKLNDVGIRTTKDMLETDPAVLMVTTGLGMWQVNSLIAEISEKLLPPVVSANDLYTASMNVPENSSVVQSDTPLDMATNRPVGQPYEYPMAFLPTGWRTLDAALRGGFPVGTLTEICGATASGKTQLVLQTCAHVALEHYIRTRSAACTKSKPAHAQITASTSAVAPSSAAAARHACPIVYYDLACRISAKRLVEIIQHCWPTLCNLRQIPNMPLDIDEVMNGIIIKQPRTTAEFSAEVADLETVLIAQKVKLVVIDSLFALTRKENMRRDDAKGKGGSGGGGGVRGADSYAAGLAAVLKRQASELGCTMLMTNTEEEAEAADAFSAYNGNSGSSIGSGSGGGLVCSYAHTMGPEWHHCVTSRLVLCSVKTGVAGIGAGAAAGSAGGGGGGEQAGKQTRVVLVEKSPLAPGCIVPFVISAGGLRD